MLILGLTGSIGMGKSTTSAMFRSLGVPVHDSDRAVHELYEGPAKEVVGTEFPGSIGPAGLDRGKLAEIVLKDPAAMQRLEQLIHPMVGCHRDSFIDQAKRAGHRLVVCDIPLLFETGADRNLDLVAVVTAPFDVQKHRVLSRPGMTEARFHAILAKQMPDSEKRRRAHVLIESGSGHEPAMRQVRALLRACMSASNR